MDCPICKEVMMQMVKVYIWCPASEQAFNKTALRKKSMKVSAAERPEPEMYICSQHGTFGAILERREEGINE